MPISVVSLLMILVGSDGTANASLSGGLLVIGGPLVVLTTGIGLLRRWLWGYCWALVLLVAFAAANVVPLVRGPSPQRTYTSPSGVPTTVLATEVNYPLHILALGVAAGVMVKLLTRPIRAEFQRDFGPMSGSSSWLRPASPASPPALPVANVDGPDRTASGRTWRVGHQGRDEMYYEEWHDGTWQRLRVSGEMLMGPAHHVIYFASPEAWLAYPAWAHDRRDEIIARIKSEFRAPDYEYHGDRPTMVTPPAPTTAGRRLAGTAAASIFSLRNPMRPAMTAHERSQWRALLVAIVIMATIGGGMGWLVVEGVADGDTWLPAPRATQRRVVVRAHEPAVFWVSIGVYATCAAGSLGLAGWGVRHALGRART